MEGGHKNIQIYSQLLNCCKTTLQEKTTVLKSRVNQWLQGVLQSAIKGQKSINMCVTCSLHSTLAE